MGWQMRTSRGPFLLAGGALIIVALVANEWVLGRWLTEAGQLTNPASRLVLALFDVTMLAAGLVLLVRRERAPWREMLLAVAATLVAVLLAEAGLRTVFAVRGWISPRDRQIAKTIGWRPVANFSSDGDVPGFGRVRYSTTRDGFRVYGDPATSKPKILVIGDSYTEAAMVTDGETYYHRLARARPDLEFFAIGGGGYGTLQEYLLLDASVDTIKPDVVLLQMHPNDLVNNSHALESRSTTNNNQMNRPYWEHGRLVARFPENAAWGPLYNLVRHSYLLRFVNVNLHFMRSRVLDSAERTLTRDDADVVAATSVTIELLSMIKKRAGAPVAAFSARPDGLFSFWSESEVCRRAGIAFIPGVGEAVEAADEAGEHVTGRPVDAHWNSRGHEIAAEVLAAWLAREGLAQRVGPHAGAQRPGS